MASEIECQKFDNLSMKFSCLLYGRNEKHLQYINSLLDDLNNLNFKLPVVTNINKAVLLIHQICTIVPSTDDELVKKCCNLITNLITQQKIQVDDRTLTLGVQWIISYLKADLSDISILQCLESLIRDNVEKIQEVEGLFYGLNSILAQVLQHLQELIGPNEVLLKLCTNSEQTVQFWSVKCLEAIVYCQEEQKDPLISLSYLETCSNIFISLLLDNKSCRSDEIISYKLLISCLRGLQSIIIQTTDIDNYDLGVLLGIAKCYMTYYLFNSECSKPQKIMPSNLSVADLKTSSTREKKGGKITKQRKPRKSNNNKKTNEKPFSDQNNSNYIPATPITENINVTVSDSDYSDSESGKTNKISVTQGRVRQAALNLLLSIVKVTDKHVMFGYWSSFIYDGSPSNDNNLNSCMLNEPSPRGRIATLNVVSTMLNGSKLYLSQAEYSEKHFAFTPFSMILGSMVQQLHISLCQALKDNSIPILTQTLKCLALLVQATPYHRLSPGLLDNVINSVKPFIRHRDTTVQVAALIVLGCILASEPSIPETISNISQKHSKLSVPEKNPSVSDPELEYAEFSSDDEEIPDNNQHNQQNNQQNNQHNNQQNNVNNLPWLLEKCLRNLGVITVATKTIVPAPVKLESLQVISAMCRNYFKEILGDNVHLLARAFEISLKDKYVDLRLHAGRAVDSVGHAMQQILSGDNPKSISIDKCIQFWLVLLNGPLPALLQTDQSPTLRSIGCDCLGSIGSDIFEHLPKDKQLLIISLLFNCSRDEENNVKGAAVRALAISVLYPSLREDLGFVMDTADAIIRNLEDSNLTVRIKSSWSLGNLSDALVLYKNNQENEELPSSLLYKLLYSCIKIVDDNNKIKSNAVRALGNLLRLVTVDLLTEDKFINISEGAIEVLVKNSTSNSDMKVRWNSCYAIGNFMKNADLFSGSVNWQQSVYPVLMDLVANFRNFKVRINAALALSIPEKRSHYSNYYFNIWKSLLVALENSQNIEDFNEFKHRDNLVDQICLSLSHLTIFVTCEDLFILHEVFVSHFDNLKLQMHRVQERLVPEKSEIVLKAANHVKNLQTRQLTNEQQTIVTDLECIFIKNDI